MCGEQPQRRCGMSGKSGSPPRVRGTDGTTTKSYVVTGITPACAGNRHFPKSCASTCRDHPRVCGEQLVRYQEISGKLGSPPRVRGTVQSKGHPAPAWGITPACAGNSLPRTGSPYTAWDHPRVCGEQLICWTVRTGTGGSPPRVRGTGDRRSKAVRKRGITPACAGNSSCLCRCHSSRRDHPRVCGEQSGGFVHKCESGGSPPRVRGTD